MKRILNLLVADIIMIIMIVLVIVIKYDYGSEITLNSYIKVEYYIDEELDLNKATIRYKHKNVIEDIEIQNEMVTNFNTKTIGKRKMTINYAGLKIFLDYIVKDYPIFLNSNNIFISDIINPINDKAFRFYLQYIDFWQPITIGKDDREIKFNNFNWIDMKCESRSQITEFDDVWTISFTYEKVEYSIRNIEENSFDLYRKIPSINKYQKYVNFKALK